MINETIMRLRVLAITVFVILGTFIFIDPAFAQGYPAYQCLVTSDRITYCSDKKVKSHAEGNAWIKTCGFSGTAKIVNSRPDGALSCPPR